ncbi:MAG TPA: nucleotidyltransferase domain-containing protein [Methylomirabilota bacterium]|nr:nucleotidyltransferase domain-containing protein [Methylomirabilota bacterium]
MTEPERADDTLNVMEPRANLSPNDARRCAERAAAHLSEDPRVQLVYLFGSAMDPDRRVVRDIDLAVLTDPALSLDELTKRQADLALATGAAIDLVSLNDASVVLAHEVVESGRCLYARSADIEADFVTRTRARYWDFMPYREQQWRLAGERLTERPRGS